MLKVINRYATPLITGLFVVSLVSGVALFLHVGPSGLHGMHEILSLVLIVPFVAHLWKNWRPFAAYFRRVPMAIGLGLSVAMAAPFLIPIQSAPSGDRAAIFGLVRTVTGATPAEVASLMHTTPEALVAALAAGGIVAGEGQTLAQAAKAAGKTDAELAALILSVRQGG